MFRSSWNFATAVPVCEAQAVTRMAASGNGAVVRARERVRPATEARLVELRGRVQAQASRQTVGRLLDRSRRRCLARWAS